MPNSQANLKLENPKKTIMADDLVCCEKKMRLAPKARSHLSLGHRPKNSNCRLTSAESAFQSGMGQNWSSPESRFQR
jgi:hypothetical protein